MQYRMVQHDHGKVRIWSNFSSLPMRSFMFYPISQIIVERIALLLWFLLTKARGIEWKLYTNHFLLLSLTQQVEEYRCVVRYRQKGKHSYWWMCVLSIVWYWCCYQDKGKDCLADQWEGIWLHHSNAKIRTIMTRGFFWPPEDDTKLQIFLGLNNLHTCTYI